MYDIAYGFWGLAVAVIGLMLIIICLKSILPNSRASGKRVNSMPKFVCKYCGMIAEDPIIESREVSEGVWAYQYEIKCPVCLNHTIFTRPEPFPSDQPS